MLQKPFYISVHAYYTVLFDCMQRAVQFLMPFRCMHHVWYNYERWHITHTFPGSGDEFIGLDQESVQYVTACL